MMEVSTRARFVRIAMDDKRADLCSAIPGGRVMVIKEIVTGELLVAV